MSDYATLSGQELLAEAFAIIASPTYDGQLPEALCLELSPYLSSFRPPIEDDSPQYVSPRRDRRHNGKPMLA